MVRNRPSEAKRSETQKIEYELTHLRLRLIILDAARDRIHFGSLMIAPALHSMG
jgi:hypothetical protein